MEVNSSELISYITDQGIYSKQAISRHLCTFGREALVGTTIINGSLCNVYDIDTLIEIFELRAKKNLKRSYTLGERYVVWLEKFRDDNLNYLEY
jgi:hypothetical protein